MKLGLTAGYSGASMTVNLDLILEAERLGFDSVWTAEAYGSDAVSPLAWIGAQTSKIKLGTAIMQMPARTPAMTAMTAMTLDALSGGRFILGLGPSGPQVVEGWHGVPYGKPLTRTREYVDDRPQDPRARGAARVQGRALPDPLRGPGRDGPRQAAEEHPARPQGHPDLHRVDRPGRHRVQRRGRRRPDPRVDEPRALRRARAAPREGLRQRSRAASRWKTKSLANFDVAPFVTVHRGRRSREGRMPVKAHARALHRRHGRARQELLQRLRQAPRLRSRRP